MSFPSTIEHRLMVGDCIACRGFCLVNNIAIAAMHAMEVLGVKRIVIIDWDVHHGNGTQQAFWESNNVMFISIHQVCRVLFRFCEHQTRGWDRMVVVMMMTILLERYPCLCSQLRLDAGFHCPALAGPQLPVRLWTCDRARQVFTTSLPLPSAASSRASRALAD